MNHKPWWKEPMVWLVAGLPLSAVLAGLITIWIAATHVDPVLTDQFRKEGMTVQSTDKQQP